MIYVFGIIAILFLVFMLKIRSNHKFITRVFKRANVIVFGKKRMGKDLLFQKVIRMRKKERYYANISYGGKWSYLDLNDLSVSPNTYKNLIEGKITKIDKDMKREGVDNYISDSGVYLPSHFNHLLNKQYPSMPIYYSLIGHLYDSNIHINYNGNFKRVWDKIREQADDYFRALGTWKIGPFFLTKIRYFEEQQAAEQNVLPLKKSLIPAGDYNAVQKQHHATYGRIKDMWILNYQWKMPYDTRAFQRIIFKDFE